MSAVNRFKGANTKFSERGKYLPPIMREEKDEQGVVKQVYDSPARYKIEIQRCIWKTSRPPKNENFYIAEFKVLETNNPRVEVGAVYTWMQKMSADGADAQVTAFMVAALGLDRRNAEHIAQVKAWEREEKLPVMLAETLEDPSDPACKNALKGCKLYVEVTQITTKGQGLPFNAHDFAPCAD